MIIIQGVDYMFLRKLGKRGVAMTEYAVLLAFVAAIGGSFASDNGLGQSIINAITGAKNAVEDAGSGQATGKHALRGLDIAEDKLTALDMQTSIPYNYLSKQLLEKFGEGTQLQAIGLDIDGQLDNVWYSKDGQLFALDSTTVDAWEGQYPSSGLQKEYESQWKKNSEVNNDSKKYYSMITESKKPADFNGMFVAYDGYGNVIQNVNTSKFSGDVAGQIADKNTIVYMRTVNGNDVTGYVFDNTNGFQVKK